MESSLVSKNSKPLTPVKDREKSHSKIRENNKFSENVNPNVPNSSPNVVKTSISPLTNSGKSQKPAPRITNNALFSPRNKIRNRKFVVVPKKKSKREEDGGRGSASVSSVVECKCKERFGAGNVKKCLCVAYENLRASQEGFFKETHDFFEESGEFDDAQEGNFQGENVGNDEDLIEVDPQGKKGISTSKRRRAKLLEDARNSAPENGKVMHLVKAFEKMLSIPHHSEESVDKECEEKVDVKKKAMQWALPGLQVRPPPVKAPETQESSFCPSELKLTAQNLGLDSRASASSSWDSSQGSICSRTSNGGRRSRRNSSESYGTIGSRRWSKKQLKVTSLKPFKLRTEQRGRQKEDEFRKKIQEMMQEEEKCRIPIAQGLPWTTDEPENLIKPVVKETTMPVDLKLHSDIRAVERAEFDQQVAEKMTLIEQYKLERERQLKLQEEEEVRRLRKDLVPKAQPMPYFDRPFIPRRSEKHPTVPRDPKFHIPQHKKIKCCLSLNESSFLAYQQ